MQVREETPDDSAEIRLVIAEAFGRDDEADLVDALRSTGDLAVSLVAEAYTEIIGHVALSRLKSPPGSLALAPVSVRTRDQDKGVGSALIEAALVRAKALGYGVVFVVGDPAFYGAFGFSAAEAKRFVSPYSGPYFMARLLNDTQPAGGIVVYPDAFAHLS